MRTRGLTAWCVASLLLLCGCAPSQRDPHDEFTAQLPVRGTSPAILERQLQPGVYLVEARERNIDLRLQVDAAGSHSESEDKVPRHGTLEKIVSVTSPAMLRIRITSVDHPSIDGFAALRIARWQRAAGEAPSERELGYAALAAAGELTAQKSPQLAQRAADKLYEAVNHFSAEGSAERGQALYTLGNYLYSVREDYAGAIRTADEAADRFNSDDDLLGAKNAATLRAAAELDLAAGMDASKQRAEQTAMYDDADRRLRDAAEYFSSHEQPIRASYAVNLRGVRAFNIGDYEAADRYFTQTVDMARANHDVLTEAMSLSNLAWVHNRRGFIARAASEYETLLPMIDRDAQPVQYAAALGNLGICLIALGDFDRALVVHNEALALYTAQGKQTERAVELAALGGLHFRIGDTERALEILRSAVAAQERAGDAMGQASTLRVAGNAASALGQHDQALAFLHKSVQLDANPQSGARTRVLIAGELRMLGDLKGAEAELAKAFQSGNTLVQANALEERARLHAERQEVSSAITDLRAADNAYVTLGLEFNRIETNSALSRALLASGDVAGASSAADEAVSITQRIRVKSANPEWRARFLSARYAPYEARIAADFAAGDAGASWRAFQTAEQVRARSLSDQLALGANRDPTDARTDELRAKLTAQQLRLEARTQKQGADDPGTVELRRAIEETRAQVDANRTAVAARESTLPKSLDKLQAELPPSTAVLAYFVGDYESHAWLLTRESLHHEKLPGLARLQKEIAATGLQNGGIRPGVKLDALARTLLGELLRDASSTRMLIIPDGPLNGVPFAALPTGVRTGEMLVDRFIIGYSPSLSLALNSPNKPAPQHTEVAVVSDPVYAPDDRRLQLAMGANGGTYRGPREASPNNLTRLPYSALEARAVLRALGNQNAVTLDGFDATASKVLALPSRNLAVLHFATHAVARSDTPEQSALYLSEYTSNGTFVPNSRITAGEIARSGLRADVVVLSGCATGDGSELRGEGVLGLTYGFLANGSRAVVASLWPIEDASTARFMSEFYGAYRSTPHPAEALRTAQLRTRELAATTVWSSFVVRANGFP